MLDILCVGDALVDIFLQIPKDNPHFGLDREKNKLFIDYGYKIGVENYVKSIGGNACNTSVGLARLGKKVGLCAEIGNDEFSNFIINSLTNENVNTSLINQNPNQKTSFSISLNYLGERTLLVEHAQRPHAFNFQNSSARFIYLTSLGNHWENAYQNALDFVKQTNSKLAFNPGTLQIDDGGKLIMEIISNTDYLFLNKQEAEKLLYGKDTKLEKDQSDIKKLLFGLKSLGTKNAIITDSNNGSFAWDVDNNIYHLDIVRVEVLEKTGAGDGYNTGFITAVIDGLGIKDSMIWGAINSASVIQKIGAQEGLLNINQLKDRMHYIGNLKPQLI